MGISPLPGGASFQRPLAPKTVANEPSALSEDSFTPAQTNARAIASFQDGHYSEALSGFQSLSSRPTLPQGISREEVTISMARCYARMGINGEIEPEVAREKATSLINSATQGNALDRFSEHALQLLNHTRAEVSQLAN